ncbi:MAG: glycosyltransferase [Ignavibacteriales bacterium]|nr:glycosyltransferase [Ignavibacteriales bacterium]
MIDLSIIIVNYNVKEYLLNLLDSIKQASKNISTEIIVVDNNSDDGSIPAINEKYPEVRTIQNNVNVGFGAANNQALEISSGKFILLLNPDTIVRENTFSEMINFLEQNPKVGIAGCKVLNPDGTLQLACRRSFPKPWVSFTKVTGLSKIFPNSKLFAKYNLTYLDENKSYEVDAISGSFMMMTREAFNKVGGFDTDFFMYGEDLDLCYRIQKAGLKVFYVHKTEIIHYKGESTKRSKIDETKIFYNAMHLFVSKHFSSSFIVEIILQFAIILRKTFAFANKNKLVIISVTFDFIIYIFLIYFSEQIHSNEKWPGFPDIFKPWVYIIPAVIQILISSLSGVYKRNSFSVLKNFIALFIGMVAITSLTFFFKQFAFSRVVVLLTYVFAVIAFSLWRIIYKLIWLNKSSSNDLPLRTVLVGIDGTALNFLNKLRSNLTIQYKLVGLIGLNIKDIDKQIENLKVIGSLENLTKVIREHQISNVIFSTESIGFDKIFSTVSQCQGENVNFLMSGSELDFMVGKSTITHVENVPLLKVEYNISMFIHKFIKRIFDIILSLILMFLIYPFVWLFSKIGLKRTFLINSLLQIPEVFIGRKSFVGPQNEEFYQDLYLGKKGITGLWFTENINENDVEEKIRINLFYAKNQNIWLDLEILGKSISKIFENMEK